MPMDAPVTYTTEYERDRAERIAANRRELESLGLATTVQELKSALASSTANAAPRAPRKLKDAVGNLPPRRSTRDRAEVSYTEAAAFPDLPRPSRGGCTRGPARQLNEEEVLRLRERNGIASTSDRDGNDSQTRSYRGAVDSGRGVRIQGGKIYDSTFGVTCHWCRQKTLASAISCTNITCGAGRRLPTTFCSKCLLNRHGEDLEEARASGCWECPQCRISCGEGCIRCCNCGPCRKKSGQAPTHQIVKDARMNGFDNAHDYLIHLVTGESAAHIAARKVKHSWGAWMSRDRLAATVPAPCVLSSKDTRLPTEDTTASQATLPKANKATCATRCLKRSSPSASPARADTTTVPRPESTGDTPDIKASAGKRQQTTHARTASARVMRAAATEVQADVGQFFAVIKHYQQAEGYAQADDKQVETTTDRKANRKLRVLQSMGLAPPAAVAIAAC